MARLVAPIMLGLVTVFAIMFLTSDGRDDSLEDTFEIQAVYEDGAITVTYLDRSQKTESAVLEVLGMSESFQKTYQAGEFEETIQFGDPPELGWKVHPVTVGVMHAELGHVQLKTEVHAAGDPEPRVIYSRP